MRQNRDSTFWIAMQEPQDEFVDQRSLSRTARSRETNYPGICDLRFAICDFDLLRWALDVGRSTFSVPNRVCFFNLSELMRKLLIKGFRTRPFGSRFAVTPMHKFHHVVERRAGEENLVYAFASHHRGIIMRDGAAAAP